MESFSGSQINPLEKAKKRTHQEYHQAEITVKYTNGKTFGDSQNSKILTRTVL